MLLKGKKLKEKAFLQVFCLETSCLVLQFQMSTAWNGKKFFSREEAQFSAKKFYMSHLPPLAPWRVLNSSWKL